MQRRDFLTTFAISVSGVASVSFLPISKPSNKIRCLAYHVKHKEAILNPTKRIPIGYKAFSVSHEKTRLYFPKFKTTSVKIWLRITAAIDFREKKKIDVRLNDSKLHLGTFDIQYAYPFQPFQIEIDPAHLLEIYDQGVSLRLVEGKRDAFFFMPTDERKDNTSLGLRPQILFDFKSNRLKQAKKTLFSMNSFSPFGWMGGCVQDALLEMAVNGNTPAENTLKIHLNHYLDDEKGVVFENPRTMPMDGQFNSIEDFLPFASICKYFPDHKSILLALVYFKKNTKPNGLIAGHHITSEACYTLAYPMAVIAISRNDINLAKLAIKQLQFRKLYLSQDKGISQRSDFNHHKSYTNWGRSVVWYLLGFVKTLAVIEKSTFHHFTELEELKREFIRTAQLTKQWQNEDGLWNSLLGQPKTKIDTTASAGIATAYAWGVKLGYLDTSYLSRAQKAYKALQNYLTPDGFITHATQINRGKEELQANGYRVMAQFALGLFSQLRFELNTY